MEDLDGMSTRGLAWLVFLPECRPDAFLRIKLLNASNAERGNIDPRSNGSLSFRGILAPEKRGIQGFIAANGGREREREGRGGGRD